MGILIKFMENSNPRISQEYQKELDMIREEVKNGNCHTFRDCLILFEDLWLENHPVNLLFSNSARKKLEKLVHDNPEQYMHVLKKIKQIQKNPLHYKTLSGDLHGSRRVHIGDFVLIYQVINNNNNNIIQDYDHHNKIYLLK